MTHHRRRQLVFVYSNIEELRLSRQEIEDAIRSLGLVDDWLFEFHAVSAGAPADVQYLNTAGNCDLFVLVIAQQMSAATREEYERAYDDNPQKVIAFYLGETNDDVRDFRSLVDTRHARTQLDSDDGLSTAVARAVEDAVLTARLVVPDLKRGFLRRLERLDQLVGLDPPMSFVPFCQEGYSQPERLEEVLRRTNHLALIGIGGAGKTYSALAALVGCASDGFLLPLYLRATRDTTDLFTLIEAAFDTVKFQPGSDLITRYCREGRLVLCLDGIDDLPSDQRARLLRAAEQFSDRFPRSRVLALSRSLDANSLQGFARTSPSELGDVAITQLFELHGYGDFRVDRDLPGRIRDLAERPFWAALLATVGTDAETGLVLLERLIDRRLSVAIPDDELGRRRLRLVLGRIALKARPATDVALAEALSQIASMWHDPAIAAVFTPQPADRLVDDARATGLIDSDEGRLVFVHPLVATTLAAHAASAQAAVPVEVDDELAAFIAGLLPPERGDEILDLLGERDIFTLARALRLRPSTQRTQSLPADGDTYLVALQRFQRIVGGSTDGGVSFLVDSAGGWTAVREITEGVEMPDEDFDDWSSRETDETAVVVWPGQPFASQLPHFLAAAEVLYRFKRRADAALPRREPKWLDSDDEDVAALTSDREHLAELASRFFVAWRDAVIDQASQLGLTRTGSVDLPEGDPQIVIHSSPGDEGRVEITWGEGASVNFVNDAEPRHRWYGLRYITEDPVEASGEWLRRRIEDELGSSLDSASWLRPELLAGWRW
jgi:hypothetical protein